MKGKCYIGKITILGAGWENSELKFHQLKTNSLSLSLKTQVKTQRNITVSSSMKDRLRDY